MDPSCESNADLGTADHLLWECTMRNKYRNQFFGTTKRRNSVPHKFKIITSNEQLKSL